MTARNSPRENTPTEQNKEDNTLVLYRLKLVEDAVKEVSTKIDGRENITKSDLTEFGTRIIERFDEKTKDLQKDIDSLKGDKADKQELRDLKKLFGSLVGILTSIMVALVITYLTTQGAK